MFWTGFGGLGSLFWVSGSTPCFTYIHMYTSTHTHTYIYTSLSLSLWIYASSLRGTISKIRNQNHRRLGPGAWSAAPNAAPNAFWRAARVGGMKVEHQVSRSPIGLNQPTKWVPKSERSDMILFALLLLNQGLLRVFSEDYLRIKKHVIWTKDGAGSVVCILYLLQVYGGNHFFPKQVHPWFSTLPIYLQGLGGPYWKNKLGQIIRNAFGCLSVAAEIRLMTTASSHSHEPPRFLPCLYYSLTLMNCDWAEGPREFMQNMEQGIHYERRIDAMRHRTPSRCSAARIWLFHECLNLTEFAYLNWTL